MTKRIRLLVALSMICLSFAVGLPGFEADGSGGICERALSDCFDDIMTQATGPFGAVICIIGYTFCKKYIDPSIGN
ncbi:MAG: hypothetical protein NTU60_05445 [Candidatus Aminicenantes bacterium]|nr:hypothetical protein [Candidatus Aminicenantes bacterium]